ncbi:MAG: M24 family metallopeptidase [Treponemataceae bacterium]
MPGKTVIYVEREAFFHAFEPFAGQNWAAHLCEEIPVLSFLDAGTAAGITRAGMNLISAASLIQRLKGLLDDDALASHERAATGLYDIVEETWSFIAHAYQTGQKVDEGTIRRRILEGMETRGLETDHPPIVAAGSHAGDPHYDFSGDGAIFQKGDVIQLDLWAKEKAKGSIYADISWVGVFDEKLDKEVDQAWAALVGAREEALSFAEKELCSGIPPTGASIDARVRGYLHAAGYQTALRHRTGHGIDTECHGSGVNLDSIEFPDQRRLLDGACFSVEPGLYFENFGLRTEIDVYIKEGRPCVSGKERQRKLLHCARSVF